MNYIFVCFFSIFLAVSTFFLLFCCYLVWLFLFLLMTCVGFVVVDVFPFLSPPTQAPPIWRWLGRSQMLSLKAFLTAYIRNATPSVWTWYCPKQPLRMTALSDQVLEVIIKRGASIDERLSKLIISSLWRRLQNTVVWCVLAWFISKLPAHVARPSPKYPDKHLHS